MRDITTTPEFLALALKAQGHLGKALHMRDHEAVSAQFVIDNMLDILGKELDKDHSDNGRS